MNLCFIPPVDSFFLTPTLPPPIEQQQRVSSHLNIEEEVKILCPFADIVHF